MLLVSILGYLFFKQNAREKYFINIDKKVMQFNPTLYQEALKMQYR